MLEILRNLLGKLQKGEKGQDLTEYALLVALIAVVVVLAIVFFGEQVSEFFSALGATVDLWLT